MRTSRHPPRTDQTISGLESPRPATDLCSAGLFFRSIPQGESIPIPDMCPTVGGFINIVNASNWPAPAYNPKTGLVYANSVDGKATYYFTDDSAKPSG